MKAKTRRRLEIEELLLYGYSQQKIADKLNISESTVYRTVKKIRDSSAKWLSDLADKNLAHVFRESLEGLRQDLMRLTELLEKPEVKNDIKLQIQIIKEISVIRTKYNSQLVQTPMVWSLDALTKRQKDEQVEQPTLKSLGGICGVK